MACKTEARRELQAGNGALPRLGRVRFLRGPFAALLVRMAALNCFPVAIVPLDYPSGIPPVKHIRRAS